MIGTKVKANNKSTLLDSLVAYWNLNEESDGSQPVSRVDSVGSNDFTDNTRFKSTAGKLGNGILFDKTGNLSADGSADLKLCDFDFTLSLIWKINNGYQDVSMLIESLGGGADDLYFGINFTGGVYNIFATVDNWNSYLDVTLTQNEATDFGLYVLRYNSVDSKLILNINNGTNHEVSSGSPSGHGANWILSTTAGNGSGITDDIGYWKTCLSADQLTELWNNGDCKAYPF